MTILEGRKALVTGASRGIGRAIAVALGQAGAQVCCVSTREGGCDDTLAALESAGAPAAFALACDVSSEEQVKDASAQALERLGGFDILVNNAGVTKDGLFLRMPVEDLDQVLNVNLRGAFLTAKAFARPLAKSSHGRIINVGSVVGIMGNAGQVNYAASKAGLIGMTKSLAKELGGRGVTANLVAPGFISTDMTAGLSDKIREEMTKNIPLGRLGDPDDIAGAVRFLASDAARYITGQVLVVDGGMTM